MKKVLNWLIYSSTNADALSLTVRGFLMGVIPYLMIATKFSGIEVEQSALNDAVNAVVEIIKYLGAGVSAVVFIIGLVRKVFYTFQGKNAVLNS